MSNIKIYNTHCCGEIGDVVVSGDIKLEGETIFEQSKYLFENKTLRNFFIK
jgi:proline racemase